MIPYGRQDINADDIAAVVAVLQSDFLTQGPQVPRFERAVADYCGAVDAIAVNSATSALHIACLALDVGPGDSVWTTPTTFVASANCARYCGAAVDFVDIDPQTGNLCPQALARKLTMAKQSNQLPKLVIPVHLCGQPCDMQAIFELSQIYGFSIIEDASHAIGARYQHAPVGNGRYSQITVFSFHPVKIITSGEGGMALTNNPALARRMRLLRSHGITSDAAEMAARPAAEIWNYQQIDLGFNYRMTELQAALGLSQLQRLDTFVRQRHAIANRYAQLLADLPLTLPWQDPDGYSSFHLYVIRLQTAADSGEQKRVYQHLIDAGINVNLHYIPVYRQPYYQRLGFAPGYCPEAEKYFTQAISIPLYTGLREAQQDQVVRVLRHAFEGMPV